MLSFVPVQIVFCSSRFQTKGIRHPLPTQVVRDLRYLVGQVLVLDLLRAQGRCHSCLLGRCPFRI